MSPPQDVKLALEVLAGGPFAHARATELASWVLEREAEQIGVASDGDASRATVADGESGGRRGRRGDS
jgi:phosphomannomutase